jgi:hypothetical protein
MKILFAIIAIAFISCNNSNNDKPADTKKDPGTATKDSVAPVNNVPETEKQYDSTVYASYIPAALKDYLDKELPGWAMPAPSKWEKYSFNQYKKDNSLVNIVPGDFNCDNQKDYALILRKKKNALAAYAFVSGNNGFTKHQLQDLGEEMDMINTGLELIPPSAVHHIGEGDEEPAPVQLKCDAVQVIWFEQAARTYYWNKNRFTYVQTGD